MCNTVTICDSHHLSFFEIMVAFRQAYRIPSFDRLKNAKSFRVLNPSKLPNDPISSPLPNLRQLLHTFLLLDSHVPKPLVMRHK